MCVLQQQGRLLPVVLVLVCLFSLVISSGCSTGGDSNVESFGGDITAPSIPIGLTAVPSSSSSILLTWNASTDNVSVAGYRIFRDGIEIDTSTKNSYSCTGLAAATHYTFKVAAYDAAGNASAPSDPAMGETFPAGAADTLAPTPPAGLTAAAASASQIDLAWTASTDDVGVAGYEVFRGDTLAGIVTGTRFSDSSLLSVTTYTYTVIAYDGALNKSAPSAPASATTLPVPFVDASAPTVPGGLTATAAGSDQIDLVWTASTDNVGVTGYKIYRAGALLKTVAPVTTASDAGLTGSTTYCYAVSAIDAAGNESDRSAESCVSTAAAPADIAGTYRVNYFIDGLPRGTAFLELNQTGASLAGTLHCRADGLNVLVTGSVSGTTVTLFYAEPMNFNGTMLLSGTAAGNTLSGTMTGTGMVSGIYTGTWTAVAETPLQCELSTRTVTAHIQWDPSFAGSLSGKHQYGLEVTLDTIPAIVSGASASGNHVDSMMQKWAGRYYVMLTQPPAVGDAYAIEFSYADSTTETIPYVITGVNDGFPVVTAPTGTVSGVTPTISWTRPNNVVNYWLSVERSIDHVHMWMGLVSGATTSIVYNADGRALGPLQKGYTYTIFIAAYDADGNYAAYVSPFTVE